MAYSNAEDRLNALGNAKIVAPDFAWLAEALHYLYAAETLRSAESTRAQLLFSPTLHMTARGIELFLKSMLVGQGVSEGQLRHDFGQDLWALWTDDRMADVRSEILIAADEECEAAAAGRWRDLDTRVVFERHLRDLSGLHAKLTGSGPRTQPQSMILGRRPHLLSATFYKVADRYARAQLSDTRNREPYAVRAAMHPSFG